MRQLQPNHWTTSDHHRSADEWEVCIRGEEMLGTSLHDMSAPTRGSKRSDAARKARVQAAPITKNKEDSMRQTIGGDGRVQWVAAPPAYGVPPDSATFNHCQRPLPVPAPFSECKAQALHTVCTGNESYQSGKKGMKSVVFGQKAEFSPTAEKKAWCRYDM